VVLSPGRLGRHLGFAIMNPEPVMRLVRLSLAIALSVVAPRSHAQQNPPAVLGPSRGAFIARLGSDTLYVERYVRDATHLEGDVAFFNPATRVAHYRLDFTPDGRVTGFTLVTREPEAAPEQPPPFERISTVRDSVITTEIRSRGVANTSANSRGVLHGPAVPFVSVSHAVFEQVVLRALASGRDSGRIEMFSAAPQPVFAVTVKRLRGDSVLIDIGVPLRARVARDGRLLALDATATTVKTLAERVDEVDLEGIVKRRLALEKSAGQPGLPSPRDTVRATVAGAALSIDYGRPSRRGRRIFGGLVPLDSVWRTGANAATQLESSRDLVLRDARGAETVVPAGKYTLWSIPGGAHGPTLIVNKQVGQWGTQYDPAQDLVRVPLRLTTSSSVVERFTIDVAAEGAGGVLRLAWDDREYALPFRVR
jgi:hypothetical protein